MRSGPLPRACSSSPPRSLKTGEAFAALAQRLAAPDRRAAGLVAGSLRRGSRRAEAPDEALAVLERVRRAGTADLRNSPSTSAGVPAVGAIARALDAYDARFAQAQSMPALRQAAAVAEKPRRAGAIALVLDPREEARARRSGGPSGVRPRLSEDGSPRRRRARAGPGPRS